jgi:hypothetical protein
MRIILIAGLLVFAMAAQASATLRVGNRVLSAGDNAERVTELLGKPSSKTHRRSSHPGSGRRGRSTRVVNSNDQPAEQWRYRHDGHVTVVTIVDGRVTDIDDRRL